MNRRELLGAAAGLAAGLATRPAAGADHPGAPAIPAWRALEAASGGRLGAAVLHTADARLEGHRLDERFPMCSTFKWLAAAHLLAQVDAGRDALDRRITFGREALLPHSPVAAEHVGEGMTLGALCEAAVTVSDNAAANLILGRTGGPAALTRYARSLGDRVTRLDRTEPALNQATPGDPRDTSSPRAMARLLRTVVLGDALAPGSRERLVRWLEASRTNGERLRARLPAGWRLGSKTGTGARGTTNDVGVFWPPGGRAPIVVAVFLTDTRASEATREGTIAAVAQRVTGAA